MAHEMYPDVKGPGGQELPLWSTMELLLLCRIRVWSLDDPRKMRAIKSELGKVGEVIADYGHDA